MVMSTGKAVFSECRKYRYGLWRVWDNSLPQLMVIGLNPSTADETKNDNTVTRCIGFARSWGFGSLCMTNIFGYRATRPKDMKAIDEPIGKDNNYWLEKLASESGMVVAAWGNHGSYLNRSNYVKELMPDLHYIHMNKSGEPTHPLYLKGDLKPKRWEYEKRTRD